MVKNFPTPEEYWPFKIILPPLGILRTWCPLNRLNQVSKHWFVTSYKAPNGYSMCSTLKRTFIEDKCAFLKKANKSIEHSF